MLVKAGLPQVRLVPVEQGNALALEARAAKRRAAIGLFAGHGDGLDLGLEALKGDRRDADGRYGRTLDAAD